MNMRRYPAILILALLSAPPGISADDLVGRIDGSVSGPQDLQRLQQGEVLVHNARTDEAGGSVRVQVLMRTDVMTVWDFIADCERVFRYVDGLRDCEVLNIRHEPGADITTLRQSVKKSWVVPKMDYVISVRRESPGRVDFSLVEGEMRNMEGGWRFEELPGDGGLVVTHQIRVRPSIPVPRWLLRRSMRKDVPDMLACLRGLVDGSGDFSREEDLDRCPKQRKGRKQG